MRVSRRVSGFYKPVLLILSVCAIIYLVQDSKSDTEDDIEETNVSIVYHFTFLLIWCIFASQKRKRERSPSLITARDIQRTMILAIMKLAAAKIFQI